MAKRGGPEAVKRKHHADISSGDGVRGGQGSSKGQGLRSPLFWGDRKSPTVVCPLSPDKVSAKLLGVGSVVEFFDPLLVPVVVVTLTGLGHGESTNRDEILESVSD